jgi:hypothetical protein
LLGTPDVGVAIHVLATTGSALIVFTAILPTKAILFNIVVTTSISYSNPISIITPAFNTDNLTLVRIYQSNAFIFTVAIVCTTLYGDPIAIFNH